MKYFVSLILLVSFSVFGQKERITVESIWKNYEFFGENVGGFRSMNDGEHFTQYNRTPKGWNVTKHSFVNYQGEGTVLFSQKDLDGLGIHKYQFNSDETKVLLMTNVQSIYRRSFSADYYLFDLKTKKLQSLDENRSPQTLASYSPDGTMVAYIFENNLFVKNLSSGKITQITKDGKRNEIINGTTDWVYEEEFAITKAYDWSPDSKNIAYLKFDECGVKEFTMTYFDDLYPTVYPFKYPKAGEDNSTVTLHIANAQKGKSKKVDLGTYEYIPRLKFSDTENALVVQTMNRHQNHLKYHLVSIDKKVINQKVFFEEKSDTYVEIDDNLIFLKDGKSLLRTSEEDGFNHIYKIGFDGSKKQITKGKWDVVGFLGVDNDNQFVYYTSAENGAINKSIYKVMLNGQEKQIISSKTGSNDAEFSKGMKYFIKTYSNANTPPVFSLCDNTGKELEMLEDNFALKKRINKYSISPKEFVTFKGAETELNGWIIKPLNFDPNKKYPVYFNVYAGPGSNMVKNTWGSANYMYHQLLAQEGYIVVSVDPRGTMYRGAKFKKSTYLQLGKKEIEDVIAVAKEVGKLPYVDKNRIGIMGWSYGGFMASLAMTKGADYFKMGIAVAPVTNWRYYDNIYTERFMRTPQENEAGYDQNSPINFTDQLKGKYLLIHGSGDDNVHHQNAMEMVKALVKSDKQFDLFIYPNKNHGIYGGNTRNHLFKMMLDYTKKNL